MKDYLLIFRGGMDMPTASPDDIQESMMKWKVWMDHLASEGKLTGGHRLTDKGVVLTGEQKKMTDGPYAEGKEIVGGYLAIKAQDFDSAVEIARGCPIFHYNGITEVREILLR